MKTEESAYKSPKDERQQTIAINVRYLEQICSELENKNVSIKKAINTLRRIQLNLMNVK